jgi:DNA mismatch repair ATPase MutL
VSYYCDESDISINCWLPIASDDETVTNQVTHSAGNKLFIIINGRPVHFSPIKKLVCNYFFQAAGRNEQSNSSRRNRVPIGYVAVTVPPSEVDVNLEPNKTSVLLANQAQVLHFLGNVLMKVYGDLNASAVPESQAITQVANEEEEEKEIGRNVSISSESDLSVGPPRTKRSRLLRLDREEVNDDYVENEAAVPSKPQPIHT